MSDCPRCLTPFERELLADFLSTLRDSMGNAGCNDYCVEVTPASRHFLFEAHVKDGDETGRGKEILEAKDGDTVCVFDFVLLAHLIERLGLERR
jgi:hypothetical protein